MKTIVGILLSLLLSLSAWAGQYPLLREIPSPGKQYIAVVTQKNETLPPTLSIRSASGESMLALPDGVLSLDAGSAIWRPDGQALAIAADTGHAGFTHLLVRKGETFVAVSGPAIPKGYDNVTIRPIRWISGNRLILDISGPHAGKADGYSFRGKSTVRVSPELSACEVMYQYISTNPRSP